MLADRCFPILVEGLRVPYGRIVGKRAEAGIQVIKPRVYKLDRNHQAAEMPPEPLMGLDIRAKMIPAKEHIAAEERIAFALEKEVFRRSRHFVVPCAKPFFEKTRLQI